MELNAVGVTGLPDVPGLSTREMQEKFDEPAKKLLAPRFNSLLAELDGLGIDGRVLNGGGVVHIRLNDDKVLETSKDGKNWEKTRSSGHLILDDDWFSLIRYFSEMSITNCWKSPLADNDGAFILDDDGFLVLADWKYKEA